jgi:hypothetical protein
MSRKVNLTAAKSAKQDEFYTRYEDIVAEVEHYRQHFKGKIVACNCDDPRWSNFSKFFKDHFKELELRGLISLFKGSDAYVETVGSKEGTRLHELAGNGDFRSEEARKYLAQADIVVTNPPFSLFREYLVKLLEDDKQFLLLGPANAITYKEVFPYIKANKLWLGVNTGSKTFRVPLSYEGNSHAVGMDRYAKLGNVYWYTNLDVNKRHKSIDLVQEYTPDLYPRYDNCEAINVDRTKNIPKDWWGLMGVPISFLEKYNPDQFEIVKFRKGDDNKDLRVKGKDMYFRILIKRRE